MRDALAKAGYTALVTGDPGELAALIHSEKPQLVLLDLILPGADGIELMAEIPELSELPVIFISGYGRDETNRARVRERRRGTTSSSPSRQRSSRRGSGRCCAAARVPSRSCSRELAIDYERRRVTVGGRAVPLTTTEYELLRILSVNAGRVVTFGVAASPGVGRAAVLLDTGPARAFVKKLRAKLGDDAASPTYIFNERGVGYRMEDPNEP